MAKKAARKKVTARSTADLPPLTGIQRRVLAHVMTSIAFENYGDCCTLEALAEEFKRSPNRFLPTLRKLEAKGYLRIEGETYPQAYPTAAALRKQNPHLSEKEVQRILERIRR